MIPLLMLFFTVGFGRFSRAAGGPLSVESLQQLDRLRWLWSGLQMRLHSWLHR